MVKSSYALLLLEIMALFFRVDELLNILHVNQYLSANLHKWQLAIPDLCTPEPHGNAELLNQIFE